MQLTVNGESHTVETGDVASLDDLLSHLEIDAARGVAVAVNERVVPQGRWNRTELDDGDRVEIIRATQGG